VPYNGSGVFAPPGTDFPAVPATVISSTKYNNVVLDIAAGLTNALTKDGQTIATADQPMGGFKHLNIDDGTQRNEYASLGQLADQEIGRALVAGGSANALTLTPIIPLVAYVAGLQYTAFINSENTGHVTLAVSGLAPKPVQIDGQELEAGEIRSGHWYQFVYDGDAFQASPWDPIDSYRVGTISTNITLSEISFGRTYTITAASEIQLPAAADAPLGIPLRLKSLTTASVTLVPDGSETIDSLNAPFVLPAFCEVQVIKVGAGAWVLLERPGEYVGQIIWRSTSTTPQGYVAADGSAISRTTYGGLNALYSAASYPYGSGDGSTTFNVPDLQGRATLGVGTGSVVEIITDAAVNTNDEITVASNADKFQTGMEFLWNVTGTPPTTSAVNQLDDGDTVFAIRISSTVIKLASSRANAVAGTAINITNAGSGTFTLTHTLTERTLAQKGGEERHTQVIGEVPAHTHNAGTTGAFNNEGGTAARTPDAGAPATSSTGGSGDMNNLQPYIVLAPFIKL